MFSAFRFAYDAVREEVLLGLDSYPEDQALRSFHDLGEYVSPLIYNYYKVMHGVGDFPLLLKYQAELLLLFHFLGNTTYYSVVSFWLIQVTYWKKHKPDLYGLLCTYPQLLGEEAGELSNNKLLTQISPNTDRKTDIKYLNMKYVVQSQSWLIHYVFDNLSNYPSFWESPSKALDNLRIEAEDRPENPLQFPRSRRPAPPLCRADSRETQRAISWAREVVPSMLRDAEQADSQGNNTHSSSAFGGELPNKLISDLDKQEIISGAMEQAKRKYFTGNVKYARYTRDVYDLFELTPPTPPSLPSNLPSFNHSSDTDDHEMIVDPNSDVETPLSSSSSISPDNWSNYLERNASGDDQPVRPPTFSSYSRASRSHRERRNITERDNDIYVFPQESLLQNDEIQLSEDSSEEFSRPATQYPSIHGSFSMALDDSVERLDDLHATP